MWKKILTVLGLTLAVCAGGCSHGGTAQENKAKSEKQQLVLWAYYETQAQREGLDKLVNDFNQSQKEYEASWEYVPMTGFIKGLSSAYTEDNLPDMAILDNPDTLPMIQLGLLEDITDQAEEWNLEKNYYSSIVQTVKYEDHYYGLPFNCNSTALIYNKKMFENAGVEIPESWEEFRTAAKKLTTGGIDGFTMCGMDGEQGAFQILSWILAAGAATDRPQQTEAYQDTFSFFNELLADGSMSENCINLTQTDIAREFVKGKTAIMQNGPWVFPMLDKSGIDYGIFPIPDKEENQNNEKAVLGGENLVVLKDKNTEGSVKFLEFCMSGNDLFKFCEDASVIPTKVSDAEIMAEKNEKVKVFEKQMEHAVSRTSVDSWTSTAQQLTDELYALVEKKAILD